RTLAATVSHVLAGSLGVSGLTFYRAARTAGLPFRLEFSWRPHLPAGYDFFLRQSRLVVFRLAFGIVPGLPSPLPSSAKLRPGIGFGPLWLGDSGQPLSVALRAQCARLLRAGRLLRRPAVGVRRWHGPGTALSPASSPDRRAIVYGVDLPCWGYDLHRGFV